QLGMTWQSNASSEGTGDQFDLIVTTLAPSGLMQRHRHNDVDLKLFFVFADEWLKARGEPIGKRRHALILQHHDRPRHRGAIRTVASCKVEIVQATAAAVAERLCEMFDADGGGKWPTASRTQRQSPGL